MKMDDVVTLGIKEPCFSIGKKYIFGLFILIYQIYAIAVDHGMVYIELDNRTNHFVHLQYGNEERFFTPIIRAENIGSKTKRLVSAMDNKDRKEKRFSITHFDYENGNPFALRGTCELPHTNTTDNKSYTVYKVSISETPGNENCHGSLGKPCLYRVCKLDSVETRAMAVPYLIFQNNTNKEVLIDQVMGFDRWAHGMVKPGETYKSYEPLLSSGWRTIMGFKEHCPNCWINKWPALVLTDITGYARDRENNRQMIVVLKQEQVRGGYIYKTDITTKSRGQFAP